MLLGVLLTREHLEDFLKGVDPQQAIELASSLIG